MKQNLFRSGRSTEEEQKILVENAKRQSVIVLPSGIQLERLDCSKNLNAYGTAPVIYSPLRRASSDRNPLKTSFRRTPSASPPVNFGLAPSPASVWNLVRITPNHTRVSERVSLGHCSREMRQILRSGLLNPRTHWKVWIPSEVNSTRNYGLQIFELQVLSTEERRYFIWTIFCDLLMALLTVCLSFFSFKSAANAPQSRVKLRRIASSSSQEASGQVKDAMLCLAFSVDEELVGEVTVSVNSQHSSCGEFFVKYCKDGRLLGRRVQKEDSGGLVCRPIELANEEEEVLTVNDADANYLTRVKKDGVMWLVLNVRDLSVLFIRDLPPGREDFVFVGVVESGTKALRSIWNCEDGGIISAVNIMEDD